MVPIRHGWSEETNLGLKLDTPGLVLAIFCLFWSLVAFNLMKPPSLAKHLIVFHTREVPR
jgi:hypothetical protein